MSATVSSETVLPSNVPAALVRDFNIYGPPGIDDDFHRAWATLLEENDAHPLVWTPENGGHWLQRERQLLKRFSPTTAGFPVAVLLFQRHTARITACCRRL